MIACRLAPLYGEREAAAVASRLLEDKYGIARVRRLADPSAEFPGESGALEDDLRRLETFEPLQYVVGWSEFCGRRFDVSPGVLIPRPETEELLRAVAAGRPRGRILDIGTGSGILAVTLALELGPSVEVSAWDISPTALDVARKNAAALGAEVRFELRDILNMNDPSRQLLSVPGGGVGASFPAAGVSSETDDNEKTIARAAAHFDIIVSNPPYVLESERAAMRDNVTCWEPPGALWVPDADPLVFYRAIARLAGQCGVREVWFEINERFGTATADLLRAEGFTDTRILQDIHGRDRIVCGLCEPRSAVAPGV